MKSKPELFTLIEKQKPYLSRKYGLKVIGVFGSYARDEQRSDSDIDILVELSRPPKISLIGLVEAEGELSDLLGVKVDLAIRKNLKKRIGKKILEEVVPV